MTLPIGRSDADSEGRSELSGSMLSIIKDSDRLYPLCPMRNLFHEGNELAEWNATRKRLELVWKGAGPAGWNMDLRPRPSSPLPLVR